MAVTKQRFPAYKPVSTFRNGTAKELTRN